jgi:hypothetical protein
MHTPPAPPADAPPSAQERRGRQRCPAVLDAEATPPGCSSGRSSRAGWPDKEHTALTLVRLHSQLTFGRSGKSNAVADQL